VSAGGGPGPREVFHVCFAVRDLDAAIPRFEEVLGVRFREVDELHIAHVEQPYHDRTEPYAIDRRITCSLEGPPHVELVELVAEERDFLSASQGEGPHHIGVWAEENESWRRQLAAGGVRTEMRSLAADLETSPYWYTVPEDLCGSRLEFLDASLRGEFAEWLTGSRELDTWSHTEAEPS